MASRCITHIERSHTRSQDLSRMEQNVEEVQNRPEIVLKPKTTKSPSDSHPDQCS